METNRNEGKEDDMIVLFSLTNTDPPLHGELEKHLSEVKEQVSRISSIKPVHKIHIPNGYVMTTRPELWDGYKLKRYENMDGSTSQILKGERLEIKNCKRDIFSRS